MTVWLVCICAWQVSRDLALEPPFVAPVVWGEVSDVGFSAWRDRRDDMGRVQREQVGQTTELAAGDVLWLHVPGDQALWFRPAKSAKSLRPHPWPVVAVATDGMLFRRIAPIPHEQAPGWWLVDERTRIYRFVMRGPMRRWRWSRQEPLAQPAEEAYAKDLFRDGNTTLLRWEHGPGEQVYRQVGPAEPWTVSLQGPGVFALDTRLLNPNLNVAGRDSYQVQVTWSKGHQLFDFETQPVTENVAWIDGRPVIVGQTQTDYLVLPRGTFQLQVTSHAEVLVNLANWRARFLHKGWAQRDALPTVQFDVPHWLRELRLEPPAGSGQATPHQRETMKGERGKKPAVRLAVGFGSLWFVGSREVALGAWQAATDVFEAFGLQQPAGQPLRRMRGGETYFRALEPLPRVGGWRSQVVFTQGVDLVREPRERPRYLDPTQAHHAGPGVRRQRFYYLVAGDFTAPLPPVPVDSELRLSLLTSATRASVQVSVDDDSSVDLKLNRAAPWRWQSPRAILPASWQRAKPGQLGQVAATGPRFEAATARWPLPAGSRQLRVRAGSALWLAVEVRISKPYRLDEREYHAAVSRLDGRPWDLFIELLQGWQPPLTATPLQEQVRLQLALHWEPLLQQIWQAHADYAGEISCEPLSPLRWQRLPTADAAQMRQRIETYARAGHFLSAMELASELYRRNRLADDRLLRAELLWALDEHYLAEMEMKSLLFASPDPDARQLASDFLLAMYAEQGDDLNRTRLLASQLLTDPRQKRARRLARHWGRTGKTTAAFDLWLTQPAADGSWGVPLALAEGWPETAANWAAAETDVGQRDLLQMVVAAFQNPERIQPSPANEEPDYAAWLTQLKRGFRILDRLSIDGRQSQPIPEAERRQHIAAVVDDYQTWLQASPGPATQRNDTDWVSADAGARWFYNRHRDLYATYRLFDEQTPLTGEVMGPVVVELEMRPLLTAGERERDGFYQVVVNDRMQPGAYIGVQPAWSFTALDAAGPRLGQAVYHRLELPAGTHRIRVYADGPMALGAQRSQPVVSLPALPAWTVRDWRQMRATGLHSVVWPSDVQWVADGQRLSPIASQPNRAKQRNAAERDQRPTLLPRTIGFVEPVSQIKRAEDVVGRYVLQGETEAAFAAAQAQHRPVREQLALLWQLVQEQPQQRARWDVAAMDLIQASHNPNVANFAIAFREGGLWRQVGYAEGGVGSQRLDVEPASPSRRVRAALVGRDEDSRLLAGNQNVGIPFGKRPVQRVQLRLAVENVSGQPARGLTAFYQWRGQKPVTLMMSPSQRWTQVTLTPRGEDAYLVVGCREALVNQFLRVQVWVDQGTGWTLWQPQARGAFFDVIMPEYPLRLALAEPTWLRVDRVVDGIYESQQQFVTAPSDSLQFKTDSEPHFVRLYERVRDPRRRDRTLPRTQHDPPVDAATMVELRQPLALTVSSATYYDGAEPLGNWSQGWSAAFVNRELSDEFDFNRANRDRFYEAGHQWRRWFGPLDLYSESNLVVRLRDRGNPSLGVRQRLQWERGVLSWRLRLGAFLQLLEPVVLDENFQRDFDDPWSLSGSGEVAWQQRRRDPWSLTGYARVYGWHLQADPVPPGPLDWDVYTDYRADHRYGFSLRETLRWRPAYDAELRLDLGMTSNEALFTSAVDQWRLRANWQQMIGGLGLEVGAGLRYSLDDDDRTAHQLSVLPELGIWWTGLARDHRQRTFRLRLRLNPDRQAANIVLSYQRDYRVRGHYRDYIPGTPAFKPLRLRRHLQAVRDEGGEP